MSVRMKVRERVRVRKRVRLRIRVGVAMRKGTFQIEEQQSLVPDDPSPRPNLHPHLPVSLALCPLAHPNPRPRSMPTLRMERPRLIEPMKEVRGLGSSSAFASSFLGAEADWAGETLKCKCGARVRVQLEWV